MHRFFVPSTELRHSHFELPEAEARHAAQVLRVHAGDPVEVLDGAGHRYSCTVERVEKRSVWLHVERQTFISRPQVTIEVLPAVPKGKAMELIIQKSVELGASRITPVVSERSVAHYDEERAVDKAEKWRLVAVEAVKQCGREWLPEVAAPKPLTECLPGTNDGFSLDLVGALLPGAVTIRERFSRFADTRDALPSQVRLWVGPEGDFSPAEYSTLIQYGVQPVTLGTHVLRCETALLSMLAVCQHEILCRS